MRLPTDKVWRAFPELDRFSDEQCRAFVKAARRKWGWRLLRVAVMAASVPVTVTLAVLVVVRAGSLVEGRTVSGGVAAVVQVVAGLIGLAIIAGGLLGALVIRDRLLRWRIRYALFNRGTCIGCHYRLVGLPVAEGNLVTCPECGLETKVDPALGELALSESGGRILRPVDERLLPRPRRPWISARRLKQIGAVALTIAVVGGLGWMGWWGYEKIRLEAQAARAAAERQGIVDAMNDLIEKHQPAAAATGEDGWSLLTTAIDRARAVDNRVWVTGNGPKDAQGHDVIPEYSWLRSTPDEANRERAAAEEALARTMLAELAAAGVYDDLKRLTGFQRAGYAFAPGSVPIAQAGFAGLAGSRNLAKINSGRMGLAIQQNDLTGFIAALEANLAIARILRLYPMLISDLVAMAIEELTHDCVLAAIMRHPSADWVGAIGDAIRRGSPTTPRDLCVRGERQVILDSLAWYFSDAARVKDWRNTAPTLSAFGASDKADKLRIGTYEENRDLAGEFMDQMQAWVSTERSQRKPATATQARMSELVMLEMTATWMPRYLREVDIRTLKDRGLQVMLALEHHRLREGRYPERLEDLVPRDLPAVPLDPWSGRGLGYKRLAQPDAVGRGYLLYSVGGDEVDDGGVAPNQFQKYSVFTPTPPRGVDYILNDRDR